LLVFNRNDDSCKQLQKVAASPTKNRGDLKILKLGGKMVRHRHRDRKYREKMFQNFVDKTSPSFSADETFP
jgi:hypothetical protein